MRDQSGKGALLSESYADLGELMSSKATLAARAAWLQLVENRTNIEIANLLNVSRLRVPRLVRWAEDHGLADISVQPPAGLDWSAAAMLRSNFGLVDALVSFEGGSRFAARLAARYVCEVLNEGGLLGVAWGGGPQAMVLEMERTPHVPQANVVQLIGGLPGEPATWPSTELLVRLSAVTKGVAAALLSPMIVPDAATARGLRQEPSIAHAFAEMKQLDVAVLGIGAWTEGGSRVRAELSAGDLERTQDVVADVCGVLLDEQGRTVHAELSERVLSIEESTMRTRPVRIGIATGEHKVRAITAALRSGLLTVLCTDAETARLVLE